MKFRTALFRIYFLVTGVVLFIVTLFLFIFPFPVRKVRNMIEVWSKFVAFGLRNICNIRFEVRGIEHLPKDKPVIIACKHQSLFETAGIFYQFLPYPVYVFKADLEKIPFWKHLRPVVGGLSVQRAQGARALKKMMEEAEDFVNEGRSLVIFPEGTRTEVGVEGRYHAGVYALAKAFEKKVDVIPVALNSGIFWGKDIPMQSGVIVMEFMPMLEKGLSKSEFMATLKEVIENKTRKLEAEAR